MSNKKFVYMFSEIDGSMRNLLGGKGANLGEMTKLGLPIPQGFTVSTEACTYYYESKRCISEGIRQEIKSAMANLEKITDKKFGDPSNPLLVSVRSGARVSMPGMMDTILNLGLNDDVVEGLAKRTNNPRFAYDSYRRFIQMFADVVKGLSKARFEEIIDEMKKARNIKTDTEFSDADLKAMITKFKDFYKKEMKEDFPTDPTEQLFGAITAVFESWENPRADYYRKMHGIPSHWGTAVNVQSMVYGNMGDTSGTGVAFTRNPATGENKLYGEYLINAQGEDVVAGIRTPEPIATLKEVMPEAYDQFVELSLKLEDYYKDMQDIEFTIEDGTLYLLQTRSGKRTANAALRIAVEMYEAGSISKERALMLVDPKQLDALLHPQFDQKALKAATAIGEGTAASPGAACGVVAFNVEEVVERVKKGEEVILVRLETSPEDIEGMNLAVGFLTARGGATSHAAVVARGMGKCCVAGCHGLNVDEANKKFTLNGKTYKSGDWISLDGSTGLVYGEKLPTVQAEISGDFEKFMTWCDEVKRLTIRTNADTPKEAQLAREYGAQGIGLCRTEHMFFEADRIQAMRETIIADTLEQRRKGLAKLLPMQRKDFEEIFEAMGNYPVTIRYLDPPLHEFLPTSDEDIKTISKEMGVPYEVVKNKVQSLHEFNPMLGHRGCRLSISYPCFAEMQTTAVIEAYINVLKRNPNYTAMPEIMIPLVGDVKELQFVKDVVVKTANALLEKHNIKARYQVGTMIEIPRATLLADEIAKEADFFSFGTNDLTQMTFGFSRDDSGPFLADYYEKKVYETDPFATIDVNGVGKLVKMATDLGRNTKKDLKIGVCGEHGGDPASIEFFDSVGLDYVSCSPFRVPIARLAAAQAAIKNKK